MAERELCFEAIGALAGRKVDGGEADLAREELDERMSRGRPIRGEYTAEVRQAIDEHTPDPAAIELGDSSCVPRRGKLRRG